ncbi:hypothetical protein V8C26DRAFT_65200 [Trichoderma gracile]
MTACSASRVPEQNSPRRRLDRNLNPATSTARLLNDRSGHSTPLTTFLSARTTLQTTSLFFLLSPFFASSAVCFRPYSSISAPHLLVLVLVLVPVSLLVSLCLPRTSPRVCQPGCCLPRVPPEFRHSAVPRHPELLRPRLDFLRTRSRLLAVGQPRLKLLLSPSPTSTQLLLPPIAPRPPAA